MSDRINDGGQAFPRDPVMQYAGMTLRDWLAGQALAGMLTNEVAASADKNDVADQAYHYADAMLEARK